MFEGLTVEEKQKIVQKMQNSIPSYNAIRLACRKRGVNTDMRICQDSYLISTSVWDRVRDCGPAAGKSSRDGICKILFYPFSRL